MARFIIARTPNQAGKIYSVTSEDKTFELDVELTPSRFGQSLQLAFKTRSSITVADMVKDCVEFSFQLADGTPKGRVREAGFSTFGKSIVEDENQKTIGFVKRGFGYKMLLFSNENGELGKFGRYRDQKLPFFLWPGRTHLAQHYQLETQSSHVVDDRLLYCVICLVVLDEWQSSAS